MWYTIKDGDSLSALAAQYMGNMMDYMLIFEANRDVLSNPDSISVGTKIWVPKGGAAKPTSESAAIFSPGNFPKLSSNQIMTYAGVGMLLITGALYMKKLRKA